MADELDIVFEDEAQVPMAAQAQSPNNSIMSQLMDPNTPKLFRGKERLNFKENRKIKEGLIANGRWETLPPVIKYQLTQASGETPNALTGEAITEKEMAEGIEAANPVGGMGGKAVKSLLGKIPGIKRIPDYMMQVAAGVKNRVPGMGTEMIEQGLIGTRGQMAKQAEKKIPVLAQELEQEVSTLPKGSISHKDVASEIMDKQKRFQTPSGYVPEADLASVEAIKQRAGDILTRQGTDPLEALALKKQAGARGWRRDTPLAGLENELNRAETMAYGKQLGNLGREAELAAANAKEMERMALMDPEATLVPPLKSLPGPSKIEKLNKAQEALFKAKRGAARGTSPLVSLLKKGTQGAMGASVGGPVGGVIAAAIPEDVALSVGAQALAKGAPQAAGLAGLLLPRSKQLLENERYLPQAKQPTTEQPLDIQFEE